MNESDTPQQLTLLTKHQVPLQFRIDDATRRRGMQHIAEIRQILAERRAAKAQATAGSSKRPAPRRAA